LTSKETDFILGPQHPWSGSLTWAIFLNDNLTQGDIATEQPN